MTHDRMRSDEFPLTHEFLAMMLGVQRTGVTVAAGALQRVGLIRYKRGNVTIIDRRGLLRRSCECYGIPRRSSIVCSEVGQYARLNPAACKTTWLMGWMACHLAKTYLGRSSRRGGSWLYQGERPLRLPLPWGCLSLPRLR